MREITLTMSEELHEWLKVQAGSLGMNVPAIILEILEDMKRNEERI